MELASKGDPKNIDVDTDAQFVHLRKEGVDEKSIYGLLSKTKVPRVVYSFGKAVGAKMGNYCTAASEFRFHYSAH